MIVKTHWLPASLYDGVTGGWPCLVLMDDQAATCEQAIPGLGRNQLILSMAPMCWENGGRSLGTAHRSPVRTPRGCLCQYQFACRMLSIERQSSVALNQNHQLKPSCTLLRDSSGLRPKE